jgi:hypothetical protein
VDVNILIAIPAFGGWCSAKTMVSVIDLDRLLYAKGIRHQITTVFNESLVTRVRNRFANKALFDADSEGVRFSHLLFIDADTVFRAEDVLTMIESDKPIVALPYALKEIKWGQIAEAAKLGIPENLLEHFAGDPCVNSENAVVSEVTPIHQVSTGTMLIQTKVLDAMAEKHPEWRFRLFAKEKEQQGGTRDYAYDFFQVGVDPNSGFYLSEDFFFIGAARALGFETYLLPHAVTGHVGSYEFTQDLGLLAASGVGIRNMKFVETQATNLAVRRGGGKHGEEK